MFTSNFQQRLNKTTLLCMYFSGLKRHRYDPRLKRPFQVFCFIPSHVNVMVVFRQKWSQFHDSFNESKADTFDRCQEYGFEFSISHITEEKHFRSRSSILEEIFRLT